MGLNSTGKVKNSEGSEFDQEKIDNPFSEKGDIDDLVFVPHDDQE